MALETSEREKFERDLVNDIERLRANETIVGMAFDYQRANGLSEISALRMCVVGLAEIKAEQMKALTRYANAYGVMP